MRLLHAGRIVSVERVGNDADEVVQRKSRFVRVELIETVKKRENKDRG